MNSSMALSKTFGSFYNHTHFVYNVSMVVKNDRSPVEKIREILDRQHGVVLSSDLAEHGIPRTYLAIMERNGEIEKVSRGVYRTASTIEDELFTFQARYRSSIFSHETALFLHDLTDRTPIQFSVTVPVGYHSTSLAESGHKVFYVRRKLFAIGVTQVRSLHGNDLRATNLERTIVDLLRSRNQVDVQLINDAMKRYVSRSDRDIDRLYRYAQQFRVENRLRETIEVLL